MVFARVGARVKVDSWQDIGQAGEMMSYDSSRIPSEQGWQRGERKQFNVSAGDEDHEIGVMKKPRSSQQRQTLLAEAAGSRI